MTDQGALFERSPSGTERPVIPRGPTPTMGPAYEEAKDRVRLQGQLGRVWDLMRDGCWRTLPEIAARTGDPEGSISADLRHLRKQKFGSHVVEKRRRTGGLWEYRVVR